MGFNECLLIGQKFENELSSCKMKNHPKFFHLSSGVDRPVIQVVRGGAQYGQN